MIKNHNQLIATTERLFQIQEEIKRLQNIYSGIDLDFWCKPLLEEATKLINEIHEYNLLSNLSFEDAVEGPLHEPILLENISELLSKLRIAAKLTQKDLAERLGWQQSNLSRFENENYSNQTIGKISEYLGALGVWLYVLPSLSEQSRKTNYRVDWFERMDQLFKQDSPSSNLFEVDTSGTQTNLLGSTEDSDLTAPTPNYLYKAINNKQTTTVI